MRRSFILRRLTSLFYTLVVLFNVFWAGYLYTTGRISIVHLMITLGNTRVMALLLMHGYTRAAKAATIYNLPVHQCAISQGSDHCRPLVTKPFSLYLLLNYHSCVPGYGENSIFGWLSAVG